MDWNEKGRESVEGNKNIRQGNARRGHHKRE
jgi:hypothetical protein